MTCHALMTFDQRVAATQIESKVSTPTPQATRSTTIPAEGRILYIMRGIPASGKSTRAKELVDIFTQDLVSQDTSDERVVPSDDDYTKESRYTQLRDQHCRIYSADDIFTDKFGKYKFHPSLLASSHQACFNNVTKALSNPMLKCVVVDNTNTQLWEMKRYVEAVVAANKKLKENCWTIEFVTPNNSWSSNPQECAKISQACGKFVPIHIISKLANNLQSNPQSSTTNDTIHKILNSTVTPGM